MCPLRTLPRQNSYIQRSFAWHFGSHFFRRMLHRRSWRDGNRRSFAGANPEAASFALDGASALARLIFGYPMLWNVDGRSVPEDILRLTSPNAKNSRWLSGPLSEGFDLESSSSTLLGLREPGPSSIDLCGLSHDLEGRFTYVARTFDLLYETREFALRIAVPVRGPDAVDAPVQFLKNALPQAIAVARRLR